MTNVIAPDAQRAIAEGMFELERIRLEENIRIARERRSPANRLGRAAHGVWRSIVTGGWE